jgi:hypothetical protein
MEQNGGDDRTLPASASHRTIDCSDDAERAFVTCGFTPQRDRFSASFGLVSEREQ